MSTAIYKKKPRQYTPWASTQLRAERKSPLGVCKCRLGGNITIDLKNMFRECALDSEKWRLLVNKILNLLFPQKVGRVLII
jgi:hypothetical protein